MCMDPLRPGIKQAVASRLGNPWALRVIIVLLWGFSTYLASSFRVGMQIVNARHIRSKKRNTRRTDTIQQWGRSTRIYSVIILLHGRGHRAFSENVYCVTKQRRSTASEDSKRREARPDNLWKTVAQRAKHPAKRGRDLHR